MNPANAPRAELLRIVNYGSTALSTVIALPIVPAEQGELPGLVVFFAVTEMQMDFIKDCFEEHGEALTEQLEGAGFSADQARQFLPEAASGIVDSAQGLDVAEIAQQLVSDGPSPFLSAINVDAIAEKLGINSDLVTKGLAAIAPVLSQAFAQKGEGLMGAVSSLAPGVLKRFS